MSAIFFVRIHGFDYVLCGLVFPVMNFVVEIFIYVHIIENKIREF